MLRESIAAALVLSPLALPALASEAPAHPVIQAMPGSVPSPARHERHGSLTLSWTGAGERVEKTVEGERWQQRFSFKGPDGKPDRSRGPAEVLGNYAAEAERRGGTILGRTARFLVFRLPRSGGGTTWCRVWSGTGSYTLDIVDEQPLATTLEFGADELRSALARDGRVALHGIHFASDSDAIDAASQPLLDEIVKLLLTDPALALEVQGHTDSTGSPAHNCELSRRRAAAVVAALVKGGVDASRLTPAGYGPDRPVAPNDGEEGRAKNRRVELVRKQ